MLWAEWHNKALGAYVFVFNLFRVPLLLSLFIRLWIICMLRTLIITKCAWKFLLTLYSRSVFHIGDIQKYMLRWSISHHNVLYCTLTVTEKKWLIELMIVVSHSWHNINKLPYMIHTAHRETKCHQTVHKLITSLNSKCYQPSCMLIHWQNSYVPCSQWHTNRRELTVKHRAIEAASKVKILCSSVSFKCLLSLSFFITSNIILTRVNSDCDLTNI
jgi:hypothetical protein